VKFAPTTAPSAADTFCAKHAPGATKLAFAVERIRRTRRWDASESPATRAYCPCALELKLQLSAF
jgi:hypothetical protein